MSVGAGRARCQGAGIACHTPVQWLANAGFAAGEHIRFLPYMFSTAVAFIDNIIVHMGEQ
ncbi:uncharacterized protein QC761_0019800 [Podospora bellae-mahoneyi]|uniref:Uncharacterized protein n=1 Tax=Podospora bellae-mahoneyi TaxID=2093777 RepID=A0ABR0G0T2_9PEZI|nr:hypothetical protein QC761_0019800 [Podospora bellae-mahoneyi]